MFKTSFEITSKEELWKLLDKSLNHIFIHQFNPNEAIEWWQASLKGRQWQLPDNMLVRNMQFDMQTNLEGLKQLLEINTYHLSIYQFNRQVPDTLVMDYLPENSREAILQQNGLKHVFYIQYEFLTIESFDAGFIRAIEMAK